MIHHFKNNRFGFTLAEVLITLGIIGVVAAMTIPTLVGNYKYMVLQNQFKAAYSDLNQAAKLFQLHHDITVSEYNAANNNSVNTLKEFSKEFNAVLKTSDLKHSSTDSDGNSIGARPYEWVSINGTAKLPSNCDTSGFFWDTQGRVIAFDDPPQAGENGPKVCIDINGEKAPNRYGVDYFIFMFTTDGYVIPWGQEHKDNPDECSDNPYYNCTVASNKCRNTGNWTSQTSCAIYALSNQHPTDSGKDYWNDFVKGK